MTLITGLNSSESLRVSARKVSRATEDMVSRQLSDLEASVPKKPGIFDFAGRREYVRNLNDTLRRVHTLKDAVADGRDGLLLRAISFEQEITQLRIDTEFSGAKAVAIEQYISTQSACSKMLNKMIGEYEDDLLRELHGYRLDKQKLVSEGVLDQEIVEALVSVRQAEVFEEIKQFKSDINDKMTRDRQDTLGKSQRGLFS